MTPAVTPDPVTPLSDPKPDENDKIPVPAIDLEIGEWIHVLFWHPFAMPGNENNGYWDTLPGRVVSVGKRICYEVSSTTPPAFGGDEVTFDRSPLRFSERDRVFRKRDIALSFANIHKLQPRL